MEGENMKIKLVKNNRYWDPKTETHLTRTNKTREFTDEEVEELDMSNIEYAIEVGILEVEGEVEGLDIEEKVEEDEEDNEQKKDTCKAVTSSGNTCSNTATWPENNPEYCHIEAHRKNHEDYTELIEEVEQQEEELETNEEEDSAETDNFEYENFNN